MAHKLDILRPSPLTERALQVHRRHMAELCTRLTLNALERATLALFEWAHPGQGCVEFLAPRRLRPLAQRHNGRGGLTGRQPLVKLPHLTPDQILRYESRLLAGAVVSLRRRFPERPYHRETHFPASGWLDQYRVARPYR